MKKFEILSARLDIPNSTNEYAINGSNFRHWPLAVRNYVDECLQGKSGSRGKDFNTRWVGSLVAETHRILERGGVFLYPADNRDGYSEGRLRMVYECGPIAFLIEQAKGKAITGIEDIMGINANNLHQRTPFIFGSAEEVEIIQKYTDDPSPTKSPLFKNRGLFNK
jgi:fructose-1,6-bisphosphatase I